MKKILGMVRNPVSMDFRVMKVARGVAEAGYESIMLGRKSPVYNTDEVSDGVVIKRVGPKETSKIASYHSSKINWVEDGDDGVAGPILKNSDQIAEMVRNLAKESESGNHRRLSVGASLAHGIASLGSTISHGITSYLEAVFDSVDASPPIPERLKQCMRSGAGLVLRLLKFSGKVFRRLYRILGTISSRSSRKPTGAKFRIGHSLIEAFWEFYPEALTIAPDVIHAHELNSLFPAVVAAKKLGVPVIYDSHELEFARNSPWDDEAFALWRQHERQLISEVDAVIAVSTGCARALEEEYGIKDVVIVRNCPSCVRQSPSLDIRSTLKLDSEIPLVVFVGKVTFNRGLETMIDVIDALPDFHLACVGPEDARYRKEIDALIRDRNLAGRIHFVPAVPPEELIEFISGADLSVAAVQDVCLSYRYCLPNKLFESAHAGLPVVVSNLPDMRDFVEKWEIGEVVSEDDAAGWAEAIKTAYDKKETYYPKEKLDRIRVENSAESEVGKVLELYGRLLAK